MTKIILISKHFIMTMDLDSSASGGNGKLPVTWRTKLTKVGLMLHYNKKNR